MDKQIYQKMREVENEHWWFVGRRRIVESVIQSMSLPKAAHILDAGCGTGGNLAMLNQYGEVKGMEMNDDAREYASSLQLGEILPGHLPDTIPHPANSFDLIVLVPAFQLLWGPHDEAHHHKRRYTAAQLKQTAKAADLELEYISYFNTWLFPLIAMTRFIQRWKSESEAEINLPSRSINHVLTRLFASERIFIPGSRLPFGVSLLAVLKSPT